MCKINVAKIILKSKFWRLTLKEQSGEIEYLDVFLHEKNIRKIMFRYWWASATTFDIWCRFWVTGLCQIKSFFAIFNKAFFRKLISPRQLQIESDYYYFLIETIAWRFLNVPFKRRAYLIVGTVVRTFALKASSRGFDSRWP